MVQVRQPRISKPFSRNPKGRNSMAMRRFSVQSVASPNRVVRVPLCLSRHLNQEQNPSQPGEMGIEFHR